MIKRSLILLLIASIGTSLQGVTISNQTGEIIQIKSLGNSNPDTSVVKLVDNGLYQRPSNEPLAITVGSKTYVVGCLNDDMRVVVGRHSDGFVQITYMPIQKKDVIY